MPVLLILLLAIIFGLMDYEVSLARCRIRERSATTPPRWPAASSGPAA